VIPSETDVLETIRRIAAQELEMTREINPSDELVADLELDSMSLTSLMASLENHFRIAMSSTDSAAVVTVADLMRLVTRHLREARP
jgi:acyl carrier protein